MNKDAAAAVARLCRAYIAFLEAPNEDSLFNWSNALHSMHDKAPEAVRNDLFKLAEFVALKALRNHFQHGGEVTHRVKPLEIGNLPLVSDLGILCLLERRAVETAIGAINEKYRASEEPMARQAMKWYGPCVNVYPAMFNLMVQVVLLARVHGLAPDDEAYTRLENAVEKDKANGRSVTITGDIHCHAASVDQVLTGLMAK